MQDLLHKRQAVALATEQVELVEAEVALQEELVTALAVAVAETQVFPIHKVEQAEVLEFVMLLFNQRYGGRK
jgi:uncharacterized coiled-coil protein SlyX